MVDANLQPTTIHCKAFEDNSGALKMGKVPKMRPRTKHLYNVYHHFREKIQNNEVTLIDQNRKQISRSSDNDTTRYSLSTLPG